ncbi:hypothetical protein L6164_003168 [Bauhinia variegata]|uniref:Uncharacterized protein n=1 Tax=Bauhinia variegata TaxID=167791 RepID=A0ACB9Q0F1_BAUVA|nr:hypothetical protein L6164_003168 [Bauhinia variegata]
MGRKRTSPASVLFGWVRKQSTKVKIFLGLLLVLFALVALKFTIDDHMHYFLASDAVHIVGIFVLLYKLVTHKTCSGLSLKTQELTALFLAVRLVCRVMLHVDIHVFLDLVSLLATILVICMMRFKLKSTYIKELDSLKLYYVVVPAAIFAIVIHPHSFYYWRGVIFAFCCYLEAVSVLPQLRFMQNAKMVETFTSHYVFALGVSRFLHLAFWIILIYETRGAYFVSFGSGYFWFMAFFIAEMVQSFILADFCYYYVKSFMQGQLKLQGLNNGGSFADWVEGGGDRARFGIVYWGSFRKSENPKPVGEPDSKSDGFDWDLKEQYQASPEQQSVAVMDPQKKREIHALRRQEAKRKREQKRGTSRGGRNGECTRESEPEEQRVSKKEKTGQNGGSECLNTKKNVNLDFNNTTAVLTASFPVAQAQQRPPYAPVQYMPFNNGYVAYPCMLPCWTTGVDKNVGAQPHIVVARRGFRPFQAEPGRVNPGSGCELEQNGERDENGDRKAKSNASSSCSSVVSDRQSTFHEGRGSSDNNSNSAQSPAEATQLNSSKENNTIIQPEQPYSSEKPNHILKQVAVTQPKEEATVESKAVPIDHSHMPNENSSNGQVKEAKTDMGKPPKPLSQTSSLPQMPYVSTTGDGPNGKTINGFLYRYTKSEVSIVCVCHGSTFSPAEFVQHAGGTDVSHPLRHITVIPSAFG